MNNNVVRSLCAVEDLGAEAMLACSTCGSNQLSTKQLQFETLPIILCFHLKRFEHNWQMAIHQKIGVFAFLTERNALFVSDLRRVSYGAGHAAVHGA